MADNSYVIEIRAASKAGYFTPAESNAYYATRYAREGVTIHWWGGNETADKHDAIVSYFLGQAAAGIKSVNYVVSDNKITLMVNPDNVAWCSEAGNPTTVSIECQPTLGAEGYKKLGWLIEQLEQRYSRRLSLYPHSKWSATACPGSISLDRIALEVQKWRARVYDQADTPAPVPAPAEPVIARHEATLYTLANAKLVNIKDLSVVKTFPLDTPLAIGATTSWNGKDFYLTVSARDQKRLQGFLVGDLKAAPTPSVVTPPAPAPPPEPPVIVVGPSPAPAPVENGKTILIAFLTGLVALLTAALVSLNS